MDSHIVVNYYGGILKMIKKLSLAVLTLFFVLITLYAASAANMTVSPNSIEWAGDYNQTKSVSVQLTNTGTENLNGISFSPSGLSGFEFTYSDNNFNLSVGENKTINVQCKLKDQADPIIYTGQLNVGNSLFSQNIPVEIDMTSASTLVIKNVKVEGKSVSYDGTYEDIEPLENIEFKIALENNINKADSDDEKIEDITVTVTIKEIEDRSEDDIELESDTFDLDENGDDDVVTLDFDVPYDVEDDKEYEVEILVEGDGVDNDFDFTWTIYLHTDKPKNFLRITDAEIDPETILCDYRNAELSVETANLGSNDQDDAVLEVKSIELGIDHEFVFEMDSDPDKDDFEVTNKLSFTVPKTTPAGIYTIDLTLFYDEDKKIDDEQVQLTVPDCAPAATTTTTVASATSTTLVGGITPGISYSQEGSFRNNVLYTVMMIVVIVAVLLGIIFLVMKMVRGF